jgi:hypothetical protein
MNKLLRYTLAMTMTIIVSCGNDEKDSPNAQALLTSGTWKVNTVTVDGVNKNDLYTNLTVSFTATGFTAVHGEPVWPASGTWTFVNAEQKEITRNDGTVVTLESISETELVLDLTWSKTTLGSGREASIQGAHTFVFNK